MTRCPYPEKVAYRTKAEALEAWRGLRRGDRQKNRRGKRRKAKDVTMYRCDPDLGGCGEWHLGRRPKKMREL